MRCVSENVYVRCTVTQTRALDGELSSYMSAVEKEPRGRVRALIGPHAGFRFSGPTAAYNYVYLTNTVRDHAIKVSTTTTTTTTTLTSCTHTTRINTHCPTHRSLD